MRGERDWKWEHKTQGRYNDSDSVCQAYEWHRHVRFLTTALNAWTHTKFWKSLLICCFTTFFSVFLWFYVWLHRSTVLCWTWNHDHQIRRRVPLFNGGFWLYCCLPLLLDNYYGVKAFILCYHHTELCRICLYTFLPWLLSTSNCHQVSSSSGYM